MAFSVSSVVKYIKSLLEGDIYLKNIEVEGEVSSITNKGHVYFTLKEENEIIRCVMFQSYANHVDTFPKVGEKITVKGSVSVYSPQGRYQIKVTSLKLSGEGELNKRFLQLKEKLEKEGLFDEKYKKPLPSYIKKIGVVTSPTGAAVHDIIETAHSKNPKVSIMISPALVQGEGSAQSVAESIAILDRCGMDVIIVGRGGGSVEDLWTFNEELVVRAIFGAETPIISAVGHETDISLSDFVADVCARTPTAAGNIAAFDLDELKRDVLSYSNEMHSCIIRSIDKRRQLALNYERQLRALSPKRTLQNKHDKLKQINIRLNNAMYANIRNKKSKMEQIARNMEALSPLVRLRQGYSYITDASGKNIYKVEDVNIGADLDIRLSDGNIGVKVTKVD